MATGGNPEKIKAAGQKIAAGHTYYLKKAQLRYNFRCI
jgi:hypothetical protein